MGIKQDIEDSLEKLDITKIDGQPACEDINQLTRELGAMLATLPTTNDGGDHGHIGMILEDTEYTTFSTGSYPFIVPKNPRLFPSTISMNEVVRLCHLAEHKQLIIKYEMYQGCLQATPQRSFKPLIPNDSRVFTAKAWVSLTAHPLNY
jgi:hypothetical protein